MKKYIKAFKIALITLFAVFTVVGIVTLRINRTLKTTNKNLKKTVETLQEEVQTLAALPSVTANVSIHIKPVNILGVTKVEAMQWAEPLAMYTATTTRGAIIDSIRAGATSTL